MMIIDRAMPGLARVTLHAQRCGEGLLAEAAHDAPRALRVVSPAFGSGGPMPARFTPEGQNASPPLVWWGVPAAARELALICEDPDAPRPDPFVHWTVYRISAAAHELPEALAEGDGPGGAVQGKNSCRREGYVGPEPPRGRGVHHYHFQLFALDAPLELGLHADRDALVAAMRGHVLAVGELVGTYERL